MSERGRHGVDEIIQTRGTDCHRAAPALSALGGYDTAVQMRPITNILKSRPKRTVYRALESLAGMDSPPIVKRFHAPGALQGWKDGLRAHREARGLRRWRALGLPAPAPITVRRSAGHWELVLEAIPGARPLPEFLVQERHDRAKLKTAAHRVGKLLADLDRSGAHHGDPHPGNLLLDHQDLPWLIDPTPSPLFSGRAAPGRDRWVRFCGQVRELTSPLFRAQVAAAYRGANGPSPPPLLESDCQRLETDAREWRFGEVQSRTQRWLRTSGATQLEGSTIHKLSPSDGVCRKRSFDSREHAQSVWQTYAQLYEHGIATIAAKSLSRLPAHTIESTAPTGASPLQGSPSPAQLGQLLGCLHDRGIHLKDITLESLYADIDGTILLDPELVHIRNNVPTPFLSPEFPDWAPRTHRKFILTFIAQQGNTRVQLRRLLEVLERA